MSILTQNCSTPFLTSIMDTQIDHHLINNHDRYLHKLKRLHSLKFPKTATSSSTTTQNLDPDTAALVDYDDNNNNNNNNNNIHRYTSLRDIDMAELGAHDFNCNNISIKNRLVKRAASAYLQSAAILATRNQNCFSSFWEKLENKTSLRTCWRIYVGEPIRVCFRPLLRFFPCMVWSPCNNY